MSFSVGKIFYRPLNTADLPHSLWFPVKLWLSPQAGFTFGISQQDRGKVCKGRVGSGQGQRNA